MSKPTPVIDALLKSLALVTAEVDKAKGGQPAAQAVLEAAVEKITEALKSVKAAGGLTMEMAGELKAIGDSLTKLSTPPSPEAAAGADGADAGSDGGGEMSGSEKRMTKAEFAGLLVSEVTKASREPDPEKKKKRLAWVGKLVGIGKSNFEGGETVPMPEIEAAYAPLGLGKPADLTTKTDQTATESAPGKVQQSDGGFSANGTNQGAQPGPTGDPLLKLVPALLSELGVEVNAGGEKPVGENGGRSNFAKSDTDQVWSRDMSRAVREERLQKRDPNRKPDADASWGKDPWSAG